MTLHARYEMLLAAFGDIWWMARRYADGRSTYAPKMFNDAMHRALEAGFSKPNSGGSDGHGEEPIWAMDGGGARYSGLSPEEVEEYNRFPGRAVKDAR